MVIASAVCDAGNWLYDIGKDIIDGLINGIEDGMGGVGSAVGKIGGDIAGGVKSALHAIHIPGFASGTDYAPGGLALVGEQGPELVNLPQGSQVLNAGQTAGALGQGDVHITIQAGTVVGAGGAQDLANMIYQELQRIARSNGFNGALPNIGILPT